MSLIEDLVASARVRVKNLPTIDKPSRMPSGTGLREAIRGKERLSVIAEYKRASPSRGFIAEHPLEKQLELYASAGAKAVSVLTEPTRFNGSIEDLEQAVDALEIPVLMKEFVVDPTQVALASRLGAGGVLLIVRCLSNAQLHELYEAAHELDLDTLVECHSPKEVERAYVLEDAVLGINNRDLDTLMVDQSLAPKILEEIPRERVVVAESGYETAKDTRDVCGLADAILIGSALMQQENPNSVRKLIKEIGK